MTVGEAVDTIIAAEHLELAATNISTMDLANAMLALVAALAQRGGMWPSQVAAAVDDVDYPIRLVERRNWPKQKTTEGGGR